MSNAELLRFDRIKIYSSETCACKDECQFDVELLERSWVPFAKLLYFFNFRDQLRNIDEPS